MSASDPVRTLTDALTGFSVAVGDLTGAVHHLTGATAELRSCVMRVDRQNGAIIDRLERIERVLGFDEIPTDPDIPSLMPPGERDEDAP